ncbi:thioesterase family protein [Actinomadura vinacea]|uniref:Thioesterase family protein n=1 Tax=Actinomadura vinacea TaxID=115336 RepID=A0ABN3KGS3_9ACTN
MTDEQPERAGFTHQIRVRYGDCDMQGVVFNPNYFAYLDDTMDMWLQAVLSDGYLPNEFDYMVKKASIEWDSPARVHDVVDLRPQVTRWGRSSFEVEVHMAVAGRRIGIAEFVFISIRPGEHESPTPVPVPEKVRAALS